jgi:hypothetical protein
MFTVIVLPSSCGKSKLGRLFVEALGRVDTKLAKRSFCTGGTVPGVIKLMAGNGGVCIDVADEAFSSCAGFLTGDKGADDHQAGLTLLAGGATVSLARSTPSGTRPVVQSALLFGATGTQPETWQRQMASLADNSDGAYLRLLPFVLVAVDSPPLTVSTVSCACNLCVSVVPFCAHVFFCVFLRMCRQFRAMAARSMTRMSLRLPCLLQPTNCQAGAGNLHLTGPNPHPSTILHF